MTLDLYMCLLAVVLRRHKVLGWATREAKLFSESNVEHGHYCKCDACRDETNEMMRWCLIDPATKPEHRPKCETLTQPRETHCHKGHPLEGDNLLDKPEGRQCRTCTNERSRKYYRKRCHPSPTQGSTSGVSPSRSTASPSPSTSPLTQTKP